MTDEAEVRGMIAKARQVAEHPLDNRDWRGIVRTLADALEAVTVERDALAAQVREARDVSTSWSVPVGVTEAVHYRALLTRVHQTLSAAPSVALDRVKAEALREAADGFRFYRDCGYRAVVIVATENYLNERADRIEKGESNDQ